MINRILFVFVLIILSLPLQAQYGYYGVEKNTASMWSIGVRGGSPIILGDVDYTLGGGYEAGIFLQKRVTKVVDFRLTLDKGLASGMNAFPSSGIRNNAALNGERGDTYQPAIAYDTLLDRFYHNYRTDYYNASIMLKLNLNRIFARYADTWDLYVSGGVGSLLYASYIDAADAQNNMYDLSQITISDPINTEDVRLQLESMRDGTYETVFAADFSRPGLGQHHILTTSYTAAAGVRFQLSDRTSLGIEGRYVFTTEDLLDAQQWDRDSNLTGDVDALVSGTISLDVSLGGK
jgi:hypothetical protein